MKDLPHLPGGAGDAPLMPWEKPEAKSVSPEEVEEALFPTEPKRPPEEDEPEPEDDEESDEGDESEDEGDDEGDEKDAEPVGDEDEDEPEDEEEDADDEEEWDLPDKSGEKVKRSEALNGYLRQRDYTRKTQELAERRRAFEATQEAVRVEREQYSAKLEALDAHLAQLEGGPVDWDKLYQENPQEYAVQMARHTELASKREQVAREYARVQEQQARDYEFARQERIRQEREMLLRAVPEWSDEAVRKAEQSELRDYALGLGFTDEQLDMVQDHKVFVMLRKAMRHDRAEATKEQKKEKLREKVKPAKKVMKSGTGQRTRSGRSKAAAKRLTAARGRLAQSGSINDAAAMFFEMID
jgi:hypothetical protein